MSEEQQSIKYDKLSLYSCIAVCIALQYFFFMRYMIGTHELNYAEWDINVATVSDYTVMMPIPKQLYENWYNKHYRHPPHRDREEIVQTNENLDNSQQEDLERPAKVH